MALDLFSAGQDCLALRKALHRRGSLLRFSGSSEALSLAQPSGKTSLAARRWTWSLYSTHPVQSLVWWALSLPFRVAVSPGR
jgi:hypothetical protein